MWTITVGTLDEDEQAEVMVANSRGNAWGIVIPESDPLYAQLLAAADQVVQRCNSDRKMPL